MRRQHFIFMCRHHANDSLNYNECRLAVPETLTVVVVRYPKIRY